MTIKNWFINKNFTNEQIRVLNSGYDIKVLKETEKALYAKISTDYDDIVTWLPKSVIETTVKVEKLVDVEVVEHKKIGHGKVLENKGDSLVILFGNEVKEIKNDRRFFV